MTILPFPLWPLAEHAMFGQNGFDASLGSVFVCINNSMPMGAYFFKSSFPFHRLVESYQEGYDNDLYFFGSYLLVIPFSLLKPFIRFIFDGKVLSSRYRKCDPMSRTSEAVVFSTRISFALLNNDMHAS